MTKEELLKSIKGYEEHLERLFDAIPRSKKGLVFNSMSAVETTGKMGLVALHCLSQVWPVARQIYREDSDVKAKVDELLKANGIT